MIHFVTGGSASGKSAFAERLACSLREGSQGSLIYLAAMKPGGPEAADRIKKHRQARQGLGFSTIEKSARIGTAPIPRGSVVLLECMGNLMANEIFDEGRSAPDVMADIRSLIEITEHLVVVGNDIFSSGSSYDASTLHYMEQLSIAQIQTAALACSVHEVSAGIPVRIK